VFVLFIHDRRRGAEQRVDPARTLDRAPPIFHFAEMAAA
jgi:hypothetical protein